MPKLTVTVTPDVWKAVNALAEKYYDGDLSECVDEHLWNDIIDTDDAESVEFLREAGVSYHQT